MAYRCADVVGETGRPATAAPAESPPDTGKPVGERSYAISLIKFPSEPVLDVGTGDCACIASILAREGRRVVASDADRGTIRTARRLLANAHLNETVSLVQDDITASSLPSSSFRNIVCFNALHHVSSLDAALTELRRILATDGRLIISDFDENCDGLLLRLQDTVRRRFRSVAAYPRPEGRVVLACER